MSWTRYALLIKMIQDLSIESSDDNLNVFKLFETQIIQVHIVGIVVSKKSFAEKIRFQGLTLLFTILKIS